MSDNILKLIPSSPTYIPKEDSIQIAIASVEKLFPLAGSVNFKQSDYLQFVDPGVNLERIICPNCGVIIDQMCGKKLWTKPTGINLLI